MQRKPASLFALRRILKSVYEEEGVRRRRCETYWDTLNMGDFHTGEISLHFISNLGPKLYEYMKNKILGQTQYE